MKLLLVLSVFIFCASLSEQKAQYVNCSEGDELLSDQEIRDGCHQVNCQSMEYGGDYIVPCPNEICVPGTKIGYKEVDNSKTFPDCCGKPICRRK